MFDRQCFDDRQNMFEGNFTADTMNVDVDLMSINNSNLEQNNTNMDPNMTFNMPVSQSPIIEPMQERQVHRTIVHEVPHVCPINTRIINHHVFRHTYSPSYSCCEENTCENVQCGSCCNFR